MRPIKLLFAVLPFMLVLTGCSFSLNSTLVKSNYLGMSTVKSAEEQLAADESDTVYIENKCGSIKVIKGSGSQITLKYITRSFKKASPEYVPVVKSETGSYRVNIKVEFDKRFGPITAGSADLEVAIPDGIKTVQCNTTWGNISVAGLEAMNLIQLTTVSGEMALKDSKANKINVICDTGLYKAENINGKQELELKSGIASLRHLEGDITADCPSGRLELDGYKGLLSAVVSSGKLYIKAADLSSGSRVYSACGTVDMTVNTFDKDGFYSFVCPDGKLFLRTPKEYRYALFAKSPGGRITGDLNYNKSFPDALDLLNEKGKSSEVKGIFVYSATGTINLQKLTK